MHDPLSLEPGKWVILTDGMFWLDPRTGEPTFRSKLDALDRLTEELDDTRSRPSTRRVDRGCYQYQKPYGKKTFHIVKLVPDNVMAMRRRLVEHERLFELTS